MVVNNILSRANEINPAKICCLGLAYKANIDDLRESPAVEIVKKLADCFNGEICVCEPNINELPDLLKDSKKIQLLSIDACLEDAEIVVLLTDHREFAKISISALADESVIDTRGLWHSFLNKVKYDG